MWHYRVMQYWLWCPSIYGRKCLSRKIKLYTNSVNQVMPRGKLYLNTPTQSWIRSYAIKFIWDIITHPYLIPTVVLRIGWHVERTMAFGQCTGMSYSCEISGVSSITPLRLSDTYIFVMRTENISVLLAPRILPNSMHTDMIYHYEQLKLTTTTDKSKYMVL